MVTIAPRRSNVHNERQFMRAQKQREVLLKKFPVGASVTWFGEDVGVVTGYTERARVKTSSGRDFNPTELVVTKLPPPHQ